jgi:hypothetical protein
MIRCYGSLTPNKPNTILSFQPTGTTIYGNSVFEDLNSDNSNKSTVTFQNAGGVTFSVPAYFNDGIYGTTTFRNRDENTSSSVNFYNTNTVTFNGPAVSFGGSKGVIFSNTYGVTFNTSVKFKYDGSLQSLGKLAFADEVKKKVTVEFSDTYTFEWYEYWADTHGETLYEKNGDEYTAVPVTIFDGYHYSLEKKTINIAATASEDITFTADGKGEAKITSGTITVS